MPTESWLLAAADDPSSLHRPVEDHRQVPFDFLDHQIGTVRVHLHREPFRRHFFALPSNVPVIVNPDRSIGPPPSFGVRFSTASANSASVVWFR